MQRPVMAAYVLGDALAKTSLGEIFRALPLAGDPQVRFLHRLPEEVGNTQEAKALILRQAKQWSAVRDLHALNLIEVGESSGGMFYVFESCQGRLLSDILDRSRQEGIPLSPDQAVYLAERIAGALASVSEQRLISGCLSPERIMVTFEGEVKLLPGILKDLQSTPLLASPLLDTYRRYLPPAQSSGKLAKAAADRYSVGAILFELLCHEPLGDGDQASRLEEARKGIRGGEPLPDSLGQILRKSLLQDAPDAYADLATLKADLDQLITSGEYSPTTFNIAFLMHTLFRGEDEAQAEADKQFMAIDRSAFLPAEPPPAPPPAPAPPIESSPTVVIPPPKPAEPAETTFGLEPEPSRKGLWIGIGAAAIVGVIAVLAWMAFSRPTGPAAPDAETQQKLDQLAKEKASLKQAQEEMAAKLKAAEDEKEALLKQVASAKTAEERQRAQRALDENQRRLQAQQDEQKRLSAPAPSAPPAGAPAKAAPSSEGGQAPSQGAAAQSGSSPPSGGTEAASAPPSPSTSAGEAAAPPAAAPAKAKLGDFVELWGVDVRPKQLNDIRIDATPGARQNRLSGTIYVEVLIDETGRVVSAKVVKGLSPDYGMNQACLDAAMKLKYSPALKDGVPVKTRLTFPILIK